jgi:hypothetical protein
MDEPKVISDFRATYACAGALPAASISFVA